MKTYFYYKTMKTKSDEIQAFVLNFLKLNSVLQKISKKES